MIAIERIAGAIEKLPPLPQTATRLAALLSSDSWTIDSCVETIKYDQALTAAVFKYANSVFSGARQPVADLRDAVIRLGGGRILEDLLARHLQRDLTETLPAYGYNERDLWRHGVAAAIAAETLSAELSFPLGGLAFSAALLHDIGKLILARAAPQQEMEAVWKTVSALRCSCERAEWEILGTTHAETGAAVIEAWGLPAGIVAGVRNHHASSDTGDPMTDCVMAANLVARSIGEGIGHEGMSVAGDALLGKRVGLTRETFEQVCARTRSRFKEVVEEFK